MMKQANINLTTTRLTVAVVLFSFFFCAIAALPAAAQEEEEFTFDQISTTSTTTEVSATDTASTTIIGGIEFKNKDLTQPEPPTEKDKLQSLLERRPAPELTFFNFFAYWIQRAVDAGIPSNTIVLILLIPVFATIINFMRTVIGLPSLEMLVPIVLSFVFVALGVATSILVLTAIILASYVSRQLLTPVKLMFFAKRSISLVFLAFFVLAALTLVALIDPASINQLSIFPLLILTLLGDSIVEVHMHQSNSETFKIAVATIALGLIGYLLATAVPVRDIIILYPETVLLTVMVNYFIGRYFGLRLTEVFRFKEFKEYGSE